jgi:hypothetical protein
MFASIDNQGTDNVPLSHTEVVAGKVGRFLLLLLCASAIALFPVAVASRAYGLIFS